MLLYPVSLPLRLPSRDPEIPFSLLGSCLSQPRWRGADGWKTVHQAWKLCLIVGTAASEATALPLGATAYPLSYFHAERAQFYTHQTSSWLLSVCAHQRRHHPSVIFVLATSALAISGLPGTKRRILTARHNGFSSRQMGWLPRHLPDAETLMALPPRPGNMICRLAWECQWNSGALSSLNSCTVPLCRAQLAMDLSSDMTGCLQWDNLIINHSFFPSKNTTVHTHTSFGFVC